MSNQELSRVLGPHGYTIKKNCITEKNLDSIKNQLTVAPFVPPDFSNYRPEPFPLYQESKSKIYLPKIYGIDNFGLPDKIKLYQGKDISLEFNGELRPEQIAPAETFLQCAKNPLKRGGILNLPCGFGKCLGLNTPVLMYDGTIKKVQDINVNDLLMGDDSTPRKVLSLARGKEMMYKITPKKGNSYIVNKSHILSLKCKDTIIDISVEDYLKISPSFHKKSLLGYKVGIDFPEQLVLFDPWIIGLWLGNGSPFSTNISIQDNAIYVELSERLRIYNLHLQYTNGYDYHIHIHAKNNKLIQTLKIYNLIENKHIPDSYKYNKRHIRLKILAGIIDSNGSYDKNCYKISQKRKLLRDDVEYIAKSLGFATSINTSTETFYEIYIYGKGLEQIPVVCQSKKAHVRKQIKDALTSKISIEKLKIDDYYGFEIDGNKRFLLGDFTVTHNTSIAIYLICQLKKKTLIIVHKDFLLQQWKERIAQFAPKAKVGLIKSKIIDIEDKDIIMASLQSIAMKNYDESVFHDIGYVIIDEIHHLGAETFSQALKKVNFQYSLGLSATVQRKDGLTKVFKWHIGDVIYSEKKKYENVEILTKEYYKSDKNYDQICYSFGNRICRPRMINNICNYIPRTQYIVDLIDQLLIKESDRKILLLSDRRSHLEKINELLDLKAIDNGFYMGGINASTLKKNEKCTVILGTYAISSEGLDISGLNTLILASPKSDIVQSVGRILRDKIEFRKYIPLVIDIVDKFSIFEKQAEKRLKYYKTNKYHIIEDKLQTVSFKDIVLNDFSFRDTHESETS